LRAGISIKEAGWPEAARALTAASLVRSGIGAFRACGGDLGQRFVDVLGLDGERSAAGGVEPGGLGEQVAGGWIEDFALEAGAGDVPVDLR